MALVTTIPPVPVIFRAVTADAVNVVIVAFVATVVLDVLVSVMVSSLVAVIAVCVTAVANLKVKASALVFAARVKVIAVVAAEEPSWTNDAAALVITLVVAELVRLRRVKPVLFE